MPVKIAEDLKTKGKSPVQYFESVSVMFTDIKDFTVFSQTLSPEDLVKELDFCFMKFDEIIDKYEIEKIKTIGDAYMCAGGLPVANKTNAEDTVRAALEIRDFSHLLVFFPTNKKQSMTLLQPRRNTCKISHYAIYLKFFNILCLSSFSLSFL